MSNNFDNIYSKDSLIKYWQNKLSGDIAMGAVYKDYSKYHSNNKASENGLCKIEFTLNNTLNNKIRTIADESSKEVFVILLACVNLLLHRYTGNKDILIGIPPFINKDKIFNILPIRSLTDKDQTFNKFLLNTNCTVKEARDHSHISYDTMMDIIGYNKFNVVVSMRDVHISKKLYLSKYDINFDFNIEENHIKGCLSYNIKLYKKRTIERMIGHFINILNSVINNPNIKLSDIDILTIEEKKQILYNFNNTKKKYPEDKSISQLFDEQVKKTPEITAVVYKDKKLSYNELNIKSDKLAAYLIRKGIEPNDIVGIMAETSIEMIVGTLAIIKAGGAYLPISCKYPKSRVKFMLEDSLAKAVLIDNKEVANKLIDNISIIDLKDDAVYLRDSYYAEPLVTKKNLANIIYTSGSTGMPKGVMIEHQNVVRLTKNQNYMKFQEGDRCFKTCASVFDVSIFEIWGILLNGLTLYLSDEFTIIDPEKLNIELIRNKIDILFLTTPLFNQLSSQKPEMFSSLKTLFVGGDTLTPDIMNIVRDKCKDVNIINAYGPTENTTYSTFFNIDRQYNESIPIGKPIANSTAYVVDEYGRLQPIGVPGELWVGGDGVARGYLNNPKLTEERFINDCFDIDKQNNKKLYKTGDKVRLLEDGNIDFLGRMDFQVKIRGYRIEIGEIEYHITSHKAVKEACVVAFEDNDKSKFLCAYYTSDIDLTSKQLREYLVDKLTDYMIPAFFVHMDSLPLTINGKIDRKVLPDPRKSIHEKYNYVKATNNIEKCLIKIWRELLKIDKIGIKDNFFKLGGNSIKAIVFASRVRKEFKVDYKVTQIFETSTIQQISEYITKAKARKFSSIKPAKEKDYYITSPMQNSLYVLSQFEGINKTYNVPIIMYINGKFNKNKLEDALNKVVIRHESLRTSFLIIDDKLVQKIYKDVNIKLKYIGNYSIEEASSVIRKFIRPFDLSKVPLMRAGLIGLEDGRYLLIIDIHHIIIDGTSLNIFFNELMKLYKNETLEPLPIQYKDFTVWQHEMCNSDLFKKQQDYWLNLYLEEISGKKIPVLNMPTDYKRPVVKNYEGRSIYFETGNNLDDRLRKLASINDATLYMILLAAYNVLLYKYTGQEDIIVGSPIIGRPHTDIEKVIGMFVNTIPMRNYPKGNITFRELLKSVRENAIKAYENQNYPFDKLVDKLKLNRDLSRNPLFDTMLVLQNVKTEITACKDFYLSPYRFDNRISKFDIMLEAYDNENLCFRVEYCTKLFKEETIKGFIKHFVNILNIITANPNIKLSEIDMFTDEKKQVFLYNFNNTIFAHDENKGLNKLFEEQGENKAPSNEIEENLVKIWQDILLVEKVGVDDNFFELGGNSLKMMQLLSRIQKLYNTSINIENLFEAKTITKMSEYIYKEKGGH